MILNQSCQILMAPNYFFNVALIEDTVKFTIASDNLFELQSCVESLLYHMCVWTSTPHDEKYTLLHKKSGFDLSLKKKQKNSQNRPLFKTTIQEKQSPSG